MTLSNWGSFGNLDMGHVQLDMRDCHGFRVAGRHFLINGSTGHWTEVAPAVAQCLARARSSRDPNLVPTLLREQCGPQMAAAAVLQLRTLLTASPRDWGHVAGDASDDGALRTIHLCITERCPLACRYCSPTNHRARSMAPQIAYRAIEALASMMQRSAVNLGTIDLTPARGEPLAEPGLLRHVVGIAEDLTEASSLRCRVSLVTNAVLLDEDAADYLRRHNVRGGISIDGPPEAHDAVRVFPDGTGSYQRTLAGVRVAHDAKILVAAAATLTGRFPHPWDVLAHLVDIGFKRVTIKPVRAPAGSALAISRAIRAVKSGYTKLAHTLVETALRGDLRYADAMINWVDFFGRFILRVMFGVATPRRCGAGTSDIAIAPDGRISACAHMSHQTGAYFGEVSMLEALDPSAAVLVKPVEQLLHCRACWARRFCGGYCLHVISLAPAGPFLDPISQSECALVKHLVELAVYVCSELSDRDGEPLRTLAKRHMDRVSQALH